MSVGSTTKILMVGGTNNPKTINQPAVTDSGNRVLEWWIRNEGSDTVWVLSSATENFESALEIAGSTVVKHSVNHPGSNLFLGIRRNDRITLAGSDDGTYTVTIDGADASFVAVGKTKPEIFDGLKLALDALSVEIITLDNGSSLDITASKHEIFYTIATSSTGSAISVEDRASATILVTPVINP